MKSKSKNNTCDVTVMSSLGFTTSSVFTESLCPKLGVWSLTDVVFIKQWSVIENQSPELTSGLDHLLQSII